MDGIKDEVNTLNSKKSLEELTKKAKAIVKEAKEIKEAEEKEPGIMNKVFDLFLATTPKKALNTAFHKTVVPKVRDTLNSGLKAFSDELFHNGGILGSSSKSSGTYISSQDYYWREEQRARERERLRREEKDKINWPKTAEDMVDKLMFPSREKATDTYHYLVRYAETFGKVTVRDLYSQKMGFEGVPYTLGSWGWTEELLKEEEWEILEQSNGKYQLFIPRPIILD